MSRSPPMDGTPAHSHAPTDSHRLLGLDILRALAILLVLAAHAWPTRAAGNWSNTCAILGVELFFVLSGYLIGGILLRLADAGKLQSWRGLLSFWRRRWFRTLPNYYLFLGLHLAWRAWVFGFPDVVAMNWQYFFFLQNFYHGPPFFFPETWSLSIEEWFYLLFAFFLCVALALFRQRWQGWFIVVGIFLAVPFGLRVWSATQLAASVQDVEAAASTWDAHVRRAVIYRLDVVMYGVLGALVAARRPQWWRSMSKLWPLGLIFTGLATTSVALDFPLHRGRLLDGLLLWPCLAVGLALLLPWFSLLPERTGLMADMARLVARLSYALYLCHGLVLLMMAKFLGRHSFWPLAKHTVAWSMTAWILAFAVAWLVYHWFEKPIMDLRERYK